MNLEIRRPELVQRVRAEIPNRHLHDADELLEQALDALNEKFPDPGNQTGAVALAALQARPYPDVDLTPPRVRLNVRDVSLGWRTSASSASRKFVSALSFNRM
ncbi:hypothetical protein [Nevskia soli]|jgi:hypothetical protein|uniref:hypothetical protein n=1 Tax=Nevskia soli TaxID=418856 RepID=UPI0015D74CF7|nr:hypothetical protein [Nevskia soli]